MKTARRRTSIAFIVAIALVGVTAVALTIFSVFNYRTERDRQLARLRAEQEILADHLAVSLALPVWNFDRAQIDKVIESGMQGRDVQAIVALLADTKRTILGRGRDPNGKVIPILGEPSPEGLLLSTRTIAAGGETVGMVKTYVTPRFTEAELAENCRQWIYDIVGLHALLILCLYLLLWRLVLHPVQALEEQAAAVSGTAGDKGGKHGATFIGELATLRESLDSMLQLLNARHAAVRTMAARILQIQDEERRKIGRDLHDSTGQTLAALEINLGILCRSQTASDARKNELITQCIDLASKCTTEIRTASYLLHPPLLDEVGLNSALRWYVDGFSKRSQVAVTLALPEVGERFPVDLELSLFRVVQEALTNIHRHSGSPTATITVRVTPPEITLEVADQGHGIPPEKLRRFHEGASNLGVGLAGMRERILQLGGDFQLDSTSAGSTVRVRLPRVKSAAPEAAQ